MNEGDGTFATGSTIPVGDRAHFVAMGDLDGDMDLDLAIANRTENTVSILLNLGDGTFLGDVTYGVGDGPFSIAIGDIDSDSDLDLFVANQPEGDINQDGVVNLLDVGPFIDLLTNP